MSIALWTWASVSEALDVEDWDEFTSSYLEGALDVCREVGCPFLGLLLL